MPHIVYEQWRNVFPLSMNYMVQMMQKGDESCLSMCRLMQKKQFARMLNYINRIQSTLKCSCVQQSIPLACFIIKVFGFVQCVSLYLYPISFRHDMSPTKSRDVKCFLITSRQFQVTVLLSRVCNFLARCEYSAEGIGCQLFTCRQDIYIFCHLLGNSW